MKQNHSDLIQQMFSFIYTFFHMEMIHHNHSPHIFIFYEKTGKQQRIQNFQDQFDNKYGSKQ